MFWYSESMKFLSLLSNNSQIGNSSLFWYNNFEQIILFPKNNTVNLKWFSFYDIGPNRDALKNNCYLATLHAQNKLEHQAIRAINVSLWLKTFDLPSNVIRLYLLVLPDRCICGEFQYYTQTSTPAFHRQLNVTHWLRRSVCLSYFFLKIRKLLLNFIKCISTLNLN